MASSDPGNVSVVVPAYRVTAYIAETLESIFAQTYARFEVIVVNDGCPDTAALEQVLQPFRSRIRYIEKENGGLASARNAGLAIARNDLIAFLDSDDIWLPHYLEKTTDSFRSDDALTAVFSDGVFFGESTLAGRHMYEFLPDPEPITFERTIRGLSQPPYLCVFRRAAVEAAGGYDAALRSCEDFDLHLRLLKQGARIRMIPEALFRYRRRPGSLSTDLLWMRQWAITVLEKTEQRNDLTTSEYEAIAARKQQFLSDRLLEQAKRALKEGNANEARKHLKAYQQLVPSRKTATLLALLKTAPALVGTLFRLRSALSARYREQS